MPVRFEEEEKKKAYEQSASYACEATSAIRTVFLNPQGRRLKSLPRKTPRTRPQVSHVGSEVIHTLRGISIVSTSLHVARLLVSSCLVRQT